MTWQVKGIPFTTNVPSQSNALTYTGSAQSPAWNNYNTSQLTIGGETSATNSDYEKDRTVTFTPTVNYCRANGTTGAQYAYRKILRKKLTSTQSTFKQSGTLTFDLNQQQSPTISGFNENFHSAYGEQSGSEAGTYIMGIELKDPANYTWYDGSDDDKEAERTIKKKNISVPTAATGTKTFTWDGAEHWPNFNYDSEYIRMSGAESGVDAGTYETCFALKWENSCTWSNGTDPSKEITIEWTIKNRAFDVPTLSPTSFTYDGNYVEVSGTTSATNKGTYAIYLKLIDKKNTVWKDNAGTAQKTISWKIS